MKYLFRFGYETPEQVQNNDKFGWDDEDSSCVFIVARSEREALGWGGEVAERFMGSLFGDKKISWKERGYAHWIENDPEEIRWAENNGIAVIDCGQYPQEVEGGLMATDEKCVTINPYFKIHPGKMQEFRNLSQQAVEQTQGEPGCLFYGFSFDGDMAFCREMYRDADALLAHAQNVGPLLTELLKVSAIARLEIHGTEQELKKLYEPLAGFKPQYFKLEYGFHR